MFRKDDFLEKDDLNIMDEGRVIMGLGSPELSLIPARRSEFRETKT